MIPAAFPRRFHPISRYCNPSVVIDPSTAIPVIAIDGPSASGKGTVAQILANRLGWHYLDSGAIYRLLALAAANRSMSLSDESALSQLALGMDAGFQGSDIFLDLLDRAQKPALGYGNPDRRLAFPGLRRRKKFPGQRL